MICVRFQSEHHRSRFWMGFGSSQLKAFWSSPSPNPPSSGAAATPGDSSKHKAEGLAELLWQESILSYTVQQGQEQLVLNTMSGRRDFILLPPLHGSQSPTLHELPAWAPMLMSPSTRCSQHHQYPQKHTGSCPVPLCWGGPITSHPVAEQPRQWGLCSAAPPGPGSPPTRASTAANFVLRGESHPQLPRNKGEPSSRCSKGGDALCACLLVGFIICSCSFG